MYSSLTHTHLVHTHTHNPTCCTHTCNYRVRRYTHRRKFVFNTYGYQVQRRPKGPSLRESYRDESEQHLYVQTPSAVAKDNGKEPIQLTPLVEKENEEEPEIFINAAASESENGVSLREDIVRELSEKEHETQVLKMNFDEPGEETKLWRLSLGHNKRSF